MLNPRTVLLPPATLPLRPGYLIHSGMHVTALGVSTSPCTRDHLLLGGTSNVPQGLCGTAITSHCPRQSKRRRVVYSLLLGLPTTQQAWLLAIDTSSLLLPQLVSHGYFQVLQNLQHNFFL